MPFVRTAVAIACAISLTTPGLAQSILCESVRGRENYCPVNTQGGVYLQSQLSRDPCYQGETWGYDRRGIWVSGGCRAWFEVGYSGNNWHYDNQYYDGQGRQKHNSGAAAAAAIGAILGAAAIAAVASDRKD
ncbi:DUF3011 domain-containing protein [Thermaurantiacus sp.]